MEEKFKMNENVVETTKMVLEIFGGIGAASLVLAGVKFIPQKSAIAARLCASVASAGLAGIASEQVGDYFDRKVDRISSWWNDHVHITKPDDSEESDEEAEEA